MIVQGAFVHNFLCSSVNFDLTHREVTTVAEGIQNICVPVNDEPICINIQRSHLLKDECQKEVIAG